MRILEEYPPIIERIQETFELKGREIFTWGDIIYNPSGVYKSDELFAHECIHEEQQGKEIEQWWEKYLTDESFRFIMELEAHQVEYAVYCDKHKDRNERARYLQAVATRLSSPLYGSIVSTKIAKERIRSGWR